MSLSLRIEIPIYFESPGKAPTYNWCLSEGAKATNNLTVIQMQIQKNTNHIYKHEFKFNHKISAKCLP